MKTITAILTATGALLTAHPAPAQATPTLQNLVAYVRNGDIYVSKGTAEKRLTTGGGRSRPRWSPDGKRIAYLTGAQLWTMNADGSGPRRLTTRAAAGPSWSPDGKWIAFASLSCSGGPGVYRIAAGGGTPEVLFPRDCRGEELPPEPAGNARQGTPTDRAGTAQAGTPTDRASNAQAGTPTDRASNARAGTPTDRAGTARAGALTDRAVTARVGTLTDRLRTDDAVAWSPDGTKIAFRGGECESIYDACLSVGTVTTGGEQTVAAYGGGSLQTQGFAVVPTWRSDGARLAWTAYQQGETTADNQPLHLVEFDPATRAQRMVGAALDRELAYLDTNRAVVTSQYRGGSWLTVVGLGDGSRRLFHSGSQPSVRPTR
ncbi:PD40 domain-containing protein [Paractinoplanes globisporus]|uniref:PD40 domain-containing protein n=1 Tax=Paractinoplanes globisporus TaxID=113565 RepID=A0ABW6WPV2_9ACTN|nr:PD40 domain-containing protein [Actinoplanes globisporus]